MSRWLCTALLLLTMVLGAVSFAHANNANTEFMDFQGLQNQAGPIPIGNLYNGGAANIPNYGVTFANFYGAIYQQGGGFASDPTRTPVIFLCTATCLGSINGTPLEGAINVGPGFTTGLNFYYTAAFATTVQVWSGANGSGTVLATISLSPNNSSCGGSYCNWTDVGLSFSGTAKSITVSGMANGIAISDITLGQSTTALPEPSSIYLFGFGAAAIWAVRMRSFFSR